MRRIGKAQINAALAALLAIALAAGQRGITAAAAQSQNDIQTKSAVHQYLIAQDGTGDFMTIQEGVDNASDGDTLIVYPGIYNEAVEVMGKEVNIIGTGKEQCVIQCDTVSYRKSPLTVGAGRIANLTIYGMNSGAGQPVLTEEEIAAINAQLVGDSWDRQKNYKGYAVHVDQNFMYGKSICFENCRIISENNHCAGIGSRGKCTISFENCELISMGGGSCLFMHDPTAEEMSGRASLIMKGCQMTSYMCPYVMTFQSLMPERNYFDLTFQNTRVSAVEYADDGSYVPLNVNTSYDVETLSNLEKTGAFEAMGLSSSAPKLIHDMTTKDMCVYMEELEKTLTVGNASSIITTRLPEGITRIGYLETDAKNIQLPSMLKHQVIAIYNRDNQPGNGWCGLNNACLTADSFGNTLVEMNCIGCASILNTAEGISAWCSSDSAAGR